MTRSQRLDPLLRVVQQRQDDAARLVAERERAQAEQEERLDALRRYADEYANAPTATTIAPALLVNRLAFREHGVERGDRAAAIGAVAGTLDQLRQSREHRRRIAAGGRWLADRQADLALRMREAGQRIHQQQHVQALVAVPLGDRGRA